MPRYNLCKNDINDTHTDLVGSRLIIPVYGYAGGRGKGGRFLGGMAVAEGGADGAP